MAAALVENPDPPLADAVLNRATPDPHILAHAIGARESVYRIVWEKKIGPRQAQVFSGSGFIIKTEGKKCLILTCAHVLRDDDGVLFNPRNGDRLLICKMWHTGDERVKEFGARVRFYNPLADLAMIEATGITNTEPLVLDEAAVVLGTTAIAVGSEYGWTRTSTVSTGITT